MRGLSGLHHNESTPQMYFYCGALALQGSVWSRQEGCRDSHYYACKEQGLAERGGQRRKESRRLRLELSNYGSSGLQSLYQWQGLFLPSRETILLSPSNQENTLSHPKSNHPSFLSSPPLSTTTSSLNFSFSLSISVPLCLL